MVETFNAGYAGKRLIVMQADEFIDLTGQYVIVPIAEQPNKDPGPIDAFTSPITDARAYVTRTHDV
jgi:hypothetical protein